MGLVGTQSRQDARLVSPQAHSAYLRKLSPAKHDSLAEKDIFVDT
jgi:hypothetical protein